MADARGGRLRVVASGDYRHTMGNARPAELGFDAYEKLAAQIDLSFLPSAPQSEATPADGLRGADALLMLGQYLPETSIAPAADRLLVVARAGVGVDKIDIDALTRHGVLLFNVPDALTEGTAAGALALMLAAARRLAPLDRLTREGRWDERQRHRGREIYDKILGVIGPGRIGAELIRLVRPFRMKVLAHSPRLTRERAERIGAEAAPLDLLLAESDFVAICAPLSDETLGMIGARELGLMRGEAFLINVGRGPILDEEALVAALTERRIAGAALDVFATQPLPPDHPLTRLDNVLLSPHCVCDTFELRRAVTAATAEGLRRLTVSELPEGVVNPVVLDGDAFTQKWATLLRRLGPARAAPSRKP